MQESVVFPANDSMMLNAAKTRRSKRKTPKSQNKAPIASPEKTPITSPITNSKVQSPDTNNIALFKTPGSALKKTLRKNHLMNTENSLTAEKKNVTFHSPANMEMSIVEIDEIMQSDKKGKSLNIIYNIISYVGRHYI